MDKKYFVIAGDIHFPYQDDKAIDAFLDFIASKRIDIIILNGDILDFYDVSSFDKRPDRINSLQKELDLSYKFMSELRAMKPEAKIVFVKGNHSYRVERYLMKHPELYSLNNLKLPNLLRLDELGIEYQDKEYRLGSLKIIHGDMVRKFSGYTARGELEKHDCSGVNSHTHRLSCYYYKTPERYLAWFEAGCLCDINPEYVDNPNWQQGFLYGYIEKDSFAVTPIPIVDGKIKCVFSKEEINNDR